MSIYVLDANIISYYLKEHEQVVENMEKALSSGDDLLIAPVAYYEVRRGILAVGSKNLMGKFDEFCQMFAVGRLDNSILNTAADIYVEQRKKGRIMEDADIFIAAFCVRHGFSLVTNNTKHFENIQNLNLLNWTLKNE